MPYTCTCGIILINSSKRIIEEHITSKKHYNIITRPYKYHNCKICNFPIDKDNKLAINRHNQLHKKPKDFKGVYYTINSKTVSFTEFCEAIDNYS